MQIKQIVLRFTYFKIEIVTVTNQSIMANQESHQIIDYVKSVI